MQCRKTCVATYSSCGGYCRFNKILRFNVAMSLNITGMDWECCVGGSSTYFLSPRSVIIYMTGCLSQKSQVIFYFLPFPISLPALFWRITSQNRCMLFPRWTQAITRSMSLHLASYFLLAAALFFKLSQRFRTLFQ